MLNGTTTISANPGASRIEAYRQLVLGIHQTPPDQEVIVDVGSYKGLLTADQITKAALADQHRITFQNPARAA